jgi:hypothetical protein
VAKSGVEARRFGRGGVVVDEGGVGAVGLADGVVLLAVGEELDGELAWMGGGVLRFLKILDLICLARATFLPVGRPSLQSR